MSMTGNIKQITPFLLTELLNEPSLITSVLYSELYSQQTNSVVSLKEDTPKLDLGSDLPAIHYLLTGSEEGGEAPLAFAVFGKTPLGEISDYGPIAQYLTSQEVKEVAEALLNISEETLRARYNPQALAGEYYPFSEMEVSKEDQLDLLLDLCKEIVDYYKVAAEKGNAMLFWIS